MNDDLITISKTQVKKTLGKILLIGLNAWKFCESKMIVFWQKLFSGDPRGDYILISPV